MRRILLLVTDLNIGGTPTVVRELALRLSRDRDLVVEVACLDHAGPVVRQLRAGNVHVTPLNARGATDIGVVFRLIKLINDRQFDTVFSFLMHANAAAAAASLFCGGVRFLQSIQTTQPSPGWHWRVQSIAQHAARKIVVPSPSAAMAATQWADVPPDKIVVIANAIDPADFARLRKASGGGGRIGFIGRLDPVKRIGDLVQALALLPPEMGLDIYGEGAERGAIERQIAELNLGTRVQLHGAIDDPRQALASIDLLVLPSRAEGFGLVLIEAMAARVPVIGADVAGIRDVIRDNQTGLLVPVADPPALAAAIRRVLEDSAVRDRLIDAAAIEVARRFSWDVILPQYRRLLDLEP